MSLPHRCLFLSDLHLGTGRTRARALLTLLLQEPSERVVLVGDILDLTSWQQRQPQFSQAEWQVLQWLLHRLAVELIAVDHEQPLAVKACVGQLLADPAASRGSIKPLT